MSCEIRHLHAAKKKNSLQTTPMNLKLSLKTRCCQLVYDLEKQSGHWTTDNALFDWKYLALVLLCSRKEKPRVGEYCVARFSLNTSTVSFTSLPSHYCNYFVTCFTTYNCLKFIFSFCFIESKSTYVFHFLSLPSL